MILIINFYKAYSAEHNNKIVFKNQKLYLALSASIPLFNGQIHSDNNVKQNKI